MASRSKQRIPIPENLRDSPVVWFSLLTRGRELGDRELATHAAEQLARLGIVIHFGAPGILLDPLWVPGIAEVIAERVLDWLQQNHGGG